MRTLAEQEEPEQYPKADAIRPIDAILQTSAVADAIRHIVAGQQTPAVAEERRLRRTRWRSRKEPTAETEERAKSESGKFQ